MVSDDVGFLLIFIVLPTALIVSGFWLILLVRREARLRALAGPDLTSEAQPDDERAPVPAASGHSVPVATIDPADELSPIVADLLYNDEPPAAPIISDERLLELLDEQDRDPMLQVIAAEPDTEIEKPDFIDATDEIEVYTGDESFAPPTNEVADSVEPATAGTSSEDGVDRAANTEAEQPSEQTESEEHSPSDDQHHAGSEPRRRRQSASRMIPSTENVRRRGKGGGRRAPKIARVPSSRNEDTVEREDGA